VYRFI